MELTQTLTDRLHTMLERIEEKGDSERADKLNDLLQKIARNKMDFTFCGHFSAGKSSLINRLCGADILPSSPIPTSANVVSIENGEEDVVVDRAADSTLHVTLAELDEACRNGVDIRRVQIHYPVPLLQDKARLLDTPGVDSTDDLHRKATEAALHMADAVFYVMDYNHVLSEMNFQYIRKLAGFGKPLYLIVNQIDKHREAELMFSSFRGRVEEALEDWKIKPEGLFFVSVKRPEDPNNEWPYLEQMIRRLVNASGLIMMNGVIQAMRQLVREHEGWLMERQSELREQLQQRAEQHESEADPEGSADAAQLETELEALHAMWAQLGEPAKQELQKILQNANVIPAPSRDIVQLYLDSRKAGFRVGLLFSERKTEAERDKRLRALRDEVETQAEASILWHVADYCKKLVEHWRLDGERAERCMSLLDDLAVAIDEQWLASLVAPGGHHDDAYTIQYAKVAAEEIKQRYRKKLWDTLEQLYHIIKPVYEERLADTARRLDAAQSRNSAFQELQMMDQQLAQYINELIGPFSALHDQALMDTNDIYGDPAGQLARHRASLAEAEQPASEQQRVQTQPAADPGSITAAQMPADERAQQGAQAKLQSAAARLDEAHDLLADMPILGGFARTLKEKAERLKQNQYTIALFGAFSAGKSSFANALLHTGVLPVSPNPTTAAINSVIPPGEDNPHGYARLHYKSAEAMYADIRLSLDKLHMELPDDDELLLDTLANADLSKASAGAKVHVAFLNAVKKGWRSFRPKLGSSELVDTAAYRNAVADETHACFLESVDLYMNSAFTEQGMVLVDTPGADSINARHTGVAFNYIKNADAILFVTYYNHAFSHADREFLLQLGRVKDTFALNKMFFIVNAADLASNEEELADVVEHVRSNLASFGLREPRIYPVSSLLAGEAQRSGSEQEYARSGMPHFEADFYTFVQEELAEMSIRSGAAELERSRQALAEWIQTMKQAQTDREAQTRMVRDGLNAAAQALRQVTAGRHGDELEKEIQELVYYVAQRVSYRYGELYNLAFNPSTFAEASLGDKEKLATAYAEMLQYLSFDISQELRATTLRVEAYMEGLLSRMHGQAAERLKSSLQGFVAPERQTSVWESPACDVSLPELPEEWKIVRQAYRNNRHFFEQGGKNVLKNSLESLLQDRIRQAALDSQGQMLEHYTRAFKQAVEQMIASLEEEAGRYAEGMLQALNSDIELEPYERRLEVLTRLSGE